VGQAVTRFGAQEFVWALGSACALNRIPFDADLTLRQHPSPHTEATLITAARSLGFRIRALQVKPAKLAKLHLPCLVVLKQPAAVQPHAAALAPAAPADAAPTAAAPTHTLARRCSVWPSSAKNS
jgi:ATP-binding cassette, subfamily B, bacterial HlyB/CyaB